MKPEDGKKSIYMILDGIREQVEKDQYWNAIARAQLDLMPKLLSGFDWFLKNAHRKSEDES